MRVLDWIGRVALLVLSTLATLAIVGSLVTVSAPGTPESTVPSEGEIAIDEARTPAPQSTPADTAPPAVRGTQGERLAAPAGVPGRELVRWLRALTYAVLGLAGFVAVLAVVAMRATAHLGAIADRR